MEEARFSCNFRLPNAEGVDFQFTVRSEQGHQSLMQDVVLLYNHLLESGYGEQAKGEVSTFDVEGVVVGQYTDKDGVIQPCYHFYPKGDALKFAEGTLYPEDQGKMPDWVRTAIERAGTNPVLQAPDKATAKRSRVFIALNRPLRGVMQVRKNQNGEVLLTDKGKPRKKLVGFRDPQGEAPVQRNPVPQGPPPPSDADDFPF